MKPSNSFKTAIKNHLEKRAADDQLFAETYKKENKNIDECCNYVMKCAKDGGASGYTDEEVFGWAVHYYDEDDIKNIKPISGKVIVNHSVELSEEDIAEAKQKAMEIVINESKADAKKELSASVELSPEDIAEAKKIALDTLVESEREKMLKKPAKKKTETITEPLIDLFSM